MSVPRKDVRSSCDEDIHAKLVFCAARAKLTVAEYVEKLIQADTTNKVDAVVDEYHALVRAGIIGKTPDLFPETGNGRK